MQSLVAGPRDLPYPCPRPHQTLPQTLLACVSVPSVTIVCIPVPPFREHRRAVGTATTSTLPLSYVSPISSAPQCANVLKDVDFSSSFLCGYLRIRGLTNDWPELTTYFDAEIIGSRYGFLTQKWGANEQEDMVHWQRFPAFRHVKNELRRPHLTMPDRDRGAVFMRWKERFLVPDHRVQDINGASFAGTFSFNLANSLWYL